jgi:ubiquinone/menaquinone biosynthesis C-methylase UbiE
MSGAADRFQLIYRNKAREYDRLVAAEDCDGQVAAALVQRFSAPRGGRILEVGVGSGRVMRILARAGLRVVGFDRAPAMVAIAAEHIRGDELSATVGVADAAELPVAGGWADGAVAGWVFGHFRSWLPDGWRAQIGRCLGEMRRACRPGAPCVVIETLGTGETEPRPPTPELAEYYRWLETEHGFSRSAVRSDYQFASVDQAAEICGEFFGEPFAARVRQERWARVPECTGLWSA